MRVKQRFPWVAVSAVAATLVVGIVAWLQIPSPGRPQSGAPLPALGFTRLDPSHAADVLAEQLAAYDPTPLFLPSEMNSSQALHLSETQRHAEGPFAALKVPLIFTAEKAGLDFPPLVAVPAGPVQGLNLANQQQASLVLGRMESAGKSLAGRGGYLEACEMGSGRVVWTLALPETADGPQGDWQPMELLGAVSRFGQIGSLVVTVSSGSDEVDEYFCSHLAQKIRIAERLPPGFYAFRVGP
jgi:hypothetical protein